MTSLQYSSVVGAGSGYTTVRTPDGRELRISGTRSTRNNNPGNIEYGKFARSQGAIGSDGRFAVFPDRATGFRAVEGLVFGGKYAGLSLKQAIERYAPPFENNSLGYAQAVANKVGVPLTTKMSQIPANLRSAVAQAMAGVEGLGRAVVKDLQGNILGRIDPRQEMATSASGLPDTMSLPPQRFQTVAARSVAPSAQNMRTAATLGALPSGGRTDLPSQTFNAPLGRVDRAPLQAISTGLTPKQVAEYQDYANTRAYAPANPVPSRPATPAPSMNNVPRGNLAAPPSAPTLSPNQVNAYQQYAQSRMAGPLTPPPSAGLLTSSVPISPPQTFSPKPATPTFVPAAPVPAAPPAPVPQQFPVAPPPPPMQVQRLQPQEFPAAPPAPLQLSATDIYNGQVGTGQATGGNTVSRFENNPNTYVTNQYGVTTATGPNGNQMAVRGTPGPGIGGPLGSNNISTPQAPSDLGNKVRGGLGTVVGGGLGGFLGGPIGAALGAVVAGDLAKGKNPLDRLGIGTFGMPVTDQFGFTQQMRFANPQRGGPFPNAPSGGFRDPSFSNRSDRSMRDISPRAADAISKGQGGLY